MSLLLYVRRLRFALGVAALGAVSFFAHGELSFASTEHNELSNPEAKVDGTILSPFWGPSITQWSSQISHASRETGLDPDLLASVIRAESNGNPTSVSYVGAVGLMGVMPTGPGLEFRPSSEELTNPVVNLEWGSIILREVVLQAGGDVGAALAAYNGGWAETDKEVTRGYAAEVLDGYARAILAKKGVDASIALQWTIGIELANGYVPHGEMLVLGPQPLSGIQTFGEAMLYRHRGRGRGPTHIKAYAVPVVLVNPNPEPERFGHSDELEDQLKIRLDQVDPKEVVQGANPRVVIACLSSIDRLRGKESTRWYFPSTCPRAQRPILNEASD